MQILRKAGLARKLNISSRTVDRKTDVRGPYYDPDFPQPIQIGPNSVGFIVEEADIYIRRLCDLRDGIQAKTLEGSQETRTDKQPLPTDGKKLKEDTLKEVQVGPPGGITRKTSVKRDPTWP